MHAASAERQLLWGSKVHCNEFLNRGEHWLCEARDTHNNRLVFDSFGRTASHIWQPRLLNVRFTGSDAEQPSHHTDGRLTQWCGAACLAFAKVAQTHGLKIAANLLHTYKKA
jgi:hypothetical protein